MSRATASGNAPMDGNLIVENAAEIVTCAGGAARCGAAMADPGVLSGALLVIEAGRITHVGPAERVEAELAARGKAGRSFPRLDAAGRCVLPGFIDAHTHLVFAGDRVDEFSRRLAGEGYLEILRQGGGILSTVRATRQASSEELLQLGLKRLDSMLAHGVTTVEAKSGYGLDRETEIRQLEVACELDRRHPVDVVSTFLGAHAVPEEFRGRPSAYVDFLIAEVLPEVAARGLARFCDVFCETGVFSPADARRLLRAAADLGLGRKIHADEMSALGGAELAAELGAVSADHLLHVSPAGVAALAREGVVAVLLPMTAFSLREPYAPARAILEAGGAVALATDFNPGSCCSESIPLLAALGAVALGLTAGEIVTALTINAAAALGIASSVGSLEVGKQGDLVVLDAPSHRHLPYRLGVNLVERVVKRGTIVYDKRNPGGSPCSPNNRF